MFSRLRFQGGVGQAVKLNPLLNIIPADVSLLDSLNQILTVNLQEKRGLFIIDVTPGRNQRCKLFNGPA